MKLSCIIPFAREYPQVMFTIKSIAEELRDRVDFEIIAVDNFCEQLAQQNYTCPNCNTPHAGFTNDKGGAAIQACERMWPWLKYVKYGDKLSHWNAKNYGVKKSTGDASNQILWFCDSHCVIHRDALYNMFKYYTTHDVNGTLHLPLTYKILEAHRTIYKPVLKIDRGEYHYTLTRYRPADEPYEVAAMSTCGMMISRRLFDKLKWWPPEMGIYGGGEQYINFTLAVMGHKKWIYPGENSCLVHHGEKRGYHYVYDDFIRNKILATYLFGGEAIARLFIQHAKGKPEVLQGMLESVIIGNQDRREYIKGKSVIDIRSWAESILAS